jgi:hypothetical protein
MHSSISILSYESEYSEKLLQTQRKFSIFIDFYSGQKSVLDKFYPKSASTN